MVSGPNDTLLYVQVHHKCTSLHAWKSVQTVCQILFENQTFSGNIQYEMARLGRNMSLEIIFKHITWYCLLGFGKCK